MASSIGRRLYSPLPLRVRVLVGTLLVVVVVVVPIVIGRWRRASSGHIIASKGCGHRIVVLVVAVVVITVGAAAG